MIYALNTRDVSDHERRFMARLIRDGNFGQLNLMSQTIHVLDTEVGEGHYHCIYCMGRVFKWYYKEKVSFRHQVDTGCAGTDKGLPGIINPYGITTRYPKKDTNND